MNPIQRYNIKHAVICIDHKLCFHNTTVFVNIFMYNCFFYVSEWFTSDSSLLAAPADCDTKQDLFRAALLDLATVFVFYLHTTIYLFFCGVSGTGAHIQFTT